jgi:mono/diheme cytochrome c family protein
MHPRVLRIALPLAAAVLAAGCGPAPDKLAARYSEVVKGYCVECHDSAGQEGGLSLEAVDLNKVAEHADIFEKVARKLRGRQMPPPGEKQPDDPTRAEFVAYLEKRLDEAAAATPNPGPASIHRLNRTEYGNAVRDLLALDVDAAEFLPADDEGYGFDNIADILRVSPSLLEQYLAGSAKIAALAVGDPGTPPVTTVYRAPSDLAQASHIEGLPLGTRGGILIHHNFPLDAEYDFNVFLLRNIVGYMTGLEWPHELEIAIDGERVFVAQVGGKEDNLKSDTNMSATANEIDARLRKRAFVTAGPHDVSIAFLERSAAETHEPLELHTRNLDLQDMNGLPVLDYVNVTGPFKAKGPGNTPSRERIFSCKPADQATARVCATEILSKLARRAYRRQPSEEDVAQLMTFYDSGAARAGFDTGIQSALRMLLTSPKFLFRDEPDPRGVAPGSLYAVGDAALASRLSFFLWSSLPDDELLDAAMQGKLGDADVFRKQVARMLADPRAEALVKNFAGQWLFLRNLTTVRPSTEEFPDFDDNLRQAMRRETELLFGNVMRENHSVLELLTADYTFVNDRLAKHYGIDGVYGSQFRKVPVTDPNRRGLLGQASILTITSYPNRTSPVLRGKWVLENVLGTPAPAPPPNVPTLAENEAGKAARTLRERLAAHRINPVCSTCHDIMDPIGLSLEHFDAVGGWRTREPGGVIDSHGQLADGRQVDGAAALREAVTSDPEQFARVFTAKLMTYALGRGVESYDMPTVRKIVRDAAPENYKFGAIVNGIVNSPAFRMRRAQSVAAPTPATVASAERQ